MALMTSLLVLWVSFEAGISVKTDSTYVERETRVTNVC